MSYYTVVYVELVRDCGVLETGSSSELAIFDLNYFHIEIEIEKSARIKFF